MKKNELFVLVALSLAILIPVPGRLAYGIIMILILNILAVSGILLKKLAGLFFADEIQTVLTTILLISVSLLMKQFVIMFSPLVALVLGIAFYMPVLTSFILGNLYTKTEVALAEEIKDTLRKSGSFSAFAIIFFAVRELFGYGTLSLPSPDGISVLNLFSEFRYAFIGTFFASIPGALVLLALCISLISFVMKKIEIFQTSNGANNDQ